MSVSAAPRVIYNSVYPSVSEPRLLLFGFCWFRRHEQPPDSDQDTNACANAQCTRGSDGLENRTRDETTEEESKDADDLVVASDNEAVEAEEVGIGHEFAPDGCEDDGEAKMSS